MVESPRKGTPRGGTPWSAKSPSRFASPASPVFNWKDTLEEVPDVLLLAERMGAVGFLGMTGLFFFLFFSFLFFSFIFLMTLQKKKVVKVHLLVLLCPPRARARARVLQNQNQRSQKPLLVMPTPLLQVLVG